MQTYNLQGSQNLLTVNDLDLDFLLQGHIAWSFTIYVDTVIKNLLLYNHKICRKCTTCSGPRIIWKRSSFISTFKVKVMFLWNHNWWDYLKGLSPFVENENASRPRSHSFEMLFSAVWLPSTHKGIRTMRVSKCGWGEIKLFLLCQNELCLPPPPPSNEGEI